MNQSRNYLIVILFSSCFQFCNTKKNDFFIEPKIAKTVPAIFINAKDSNFRKHQDTLFFKNILYTGYRYSLNDAGDTLSLDSYFNGLEEGYQKKWFSKKQLQEIRFYINGKKEVVHQGWWSNGKQKYYFTAYNNEYDGAFREWISNGLLIKHFHYTKGYENGSQRLWWADGTVRANYVIKDGKKYGLLGLKICKNPYDSIKTK